MTISTHHKHLNYSKSVVFVDTVIPSLCHRAVNFFDSMATRRQCEGFTKSCWYIKTRYIKARI